MKLYLRPIQFYDPVKTFNNPERNGRNYFAFTQDGRKFSVQREVFALALESYKLIQKELETEKITPEIIHEQLSAFVEIILEPLLIVVTSHFDNKNFKLEDEFGKSRKLEEALNVFDIAQIIVFLNDLTSRASDMSFNFLQLDKEVHAFTQLLLFDDISMLEGRFTNEDDIEFFVSTYSAMEKSRWYASSNIISGNFNKRRAKIAAFARHKENHELKKEAMDYYKLNQSEFKSRIEAARYISKHIVPVTERTVDRWLSER